MRTWTTTPKVAPVPGKYYCGVSDVMAYLGCKENKAYTVIRELRNELINDGKITPEYPQGKVPRKYFFQRCMIEE